jgi:hypothetical protein
MPICQLPWPAICLLARCFLGVPRPAFVVRYYPVGFPPERLVVCLQLSLAQTSFQNWAGQATERELSCSCNRTRRHTRHSNCTTGTWALELQQSAMSFCFLIAEVCAAASASLPPHYSSSMFLLVTRGAGAATHPAQPISGALMGTPSVNIC